MLAELLAALGLSSYSSTHALRCLRAAAISVLQGLARDRANAGRMLAGVPPQLWGALGLSFSQALCLKLLAAGQESGRV